MLKFKNYNHLTKKQKRMKYSHIIWDFNGTLLDDTALCVKVMNKTLAKRNMPLIDEEAYRDMFCFPVVDYYKKLGFTFKDESFEKVGMEFIDNYEKEKLSCSLNSNILEMLTYLKEQGLSQSILSAYHTDSLNSFTRHLGINNFFDDIIGLDNHYATSKVGLGLEWIKDNRIDSKKVLMIGDTIHDAEVAAAMGIDIVLYPHGHQSKKILKASGTKILEDFMQITDIIKQ